MERLEVDKLVKVVVVVAGAVVTAASATYLWKTYEEYSGAADRRAAIASINEKLERRREQRRMMLTSLDCRSTALPVIAEAGKPEFQFSGLDLQVSENLRACLESGKMLPYEKAELDRLGISQSVLK